MPDLTKRCPASNNQHHCRECPVVEEQWHLQRLLNDMAWAKGVQEYIGDGEISDADIQQLKIQPQPLTPKEVCWFCLLLQGVSSEQIAERFNISYKSTVRPALSKTLYKYVKRLTNKPIKDWAQVRVYLELATENNQSKYRKGVISSIREEPLEIRLVISGNQDIDAILNKLRQIPGLAELIKREPYDS